MTMTISPDVTWRADALLDLYCSDSPGEVTFPVDSIGLAKNMGRKVYNVELPDNLPSALIKKPGHPAMILLNKANSDEQRRLTCAHDLGHYVIHADKGRDLDEFAYMDEGDNRHCSDDEWQAREFAEELLMPAFVVRQQAVVVRSPVILAGVFGVSVATIRKRLSELNIPTYA